MARRLRRGGQGGDTWAGFVDALSSLLMILIFVLVVFMLAQFFLGVALSGRDQALARLEARVAELADMLALEREGNADMRLELAQLSAELQRANQGRDEAAGALALLEGELAATEAELARAMEEVTTGRDTIELKLAEIASLQRDLDALRQMREELEDEVGRIVLLLEEARAREIESAEALDESAMQAAASEERIAALLAELTAERDRSLALEARVSDEAERTVLAQREIEAHELRIEELMAQVTLTEEERAEALRVSDRRLAQIALLNQQLAALRQQIAALNEALEASEAENVTNEVQIAELGARLNAALAGKVQELARYRSAFLEALMDVLAGREDIRVEGDRFVLPAELLFESGSAEIAPEGHAQLDTVAALILELADEIPADVPWIIRVDGHTDVVPIATPEFASNWELSTARATAVVRYLVARGVPPDRLAATGFGEFQLIEPGRDPDFLRANRRIEFKLTEQ